MIEKDPHGKDPHEAGAKLDHDKNRLGLVLGGFACALQEVGKIGTYGAKKYSDSGWTKVPNGEERYTDAMLRHILKDLAGERHDPDTELLHAAHACWNALARLELIIGKGQPELKVDVISDYYENNARAQRAANRLHNQD